VFKVGDLVKDTRNENNRGKGVIVRIIKNFEYDYDYRAEIDVMHVIWTVSNDKERFEMWWTWDPLGKEYCMRHDLNKAMRHIEKIN